MQEEFYAILKLTSGEEVLALISTDDNDGDPVIVMQNPITMKVLHSPHGMHIKVKSWMEMSNDSIFIIRPDKVITMTETHDDKLIEIYNSYITDEDDIDLYKSPDYSTDEPTGKIKPSRKMGYLSSVEEARKSLEDLYNLKDTKES
jgi:hypothetical protein